MVIGDLASDYRCISYDHRGWGESDSPPEGYGLAEMATDAEELMVTMTGRFVPAIAMITGNVEARHRGGFMSLNSCVQQTFSGLGTSFGGYLIIDQAHQPLQNYGLIGWIAAAIAIACVGLAARLRRPAAPASPSDAASAEIMG